MTPDAATSRVMRAMYSRETSDRMLARACIEVMAKHHGVLALDCDSCQAYLQRRTEEARDAQAEYDRAVAALKQANAEAAA
jgi:hypothetical protein